MSPRGATLAPPVAPSGRAGTAGSGGAADPGGAADLGGRAAGLRVVDVTLWYGARSGGIKTYLDAKRRHVAATGAFAHHVVVPGRHTGENGGLHTVRGVKVTRNDYRIPPGGRGLRRALERIRPDVVLLHDPYWTPRAAIAAAHAQGAAVVAVHHGSAALAAAGMPGPDGPWARGFRAWMTHAYRDVDAVMSVIDPGPCSGRTADLPLRLGLDPTFRPQPAVRRGDHVLYVGRLSRAKGLPELLEATRRALEPWRLEIVGDGPWRQGLPGEIAALGLRDRVRLRPYVTDRAELARRYAEASCVVMPGPNETFGLVALEAAACGARVVTTADAPAAAAIEGLGETFPAGDAGELGRAIGRARRAPRDLARAGRLAAAHAWPILFDAEQRDLTALCARVRTPAARTA